MKENITLFLEKNVPTDPSKWQYYVSQAKKKFDVYPSAYANGWAAKQYKDAGGKWKTEGEEPQHVAQGLPQTKELKGKLIGEKLVKYFSEIGLKHAMYQTENGDIKVIGLNKEQVKEAIAKVVEGWEKMKEGLNEEPAKSESEKIQNANNRIAKLRMQMAQTKSQSAKDVLQARLKNALQRLSDKKKQLGIKAPHREGMPGGVGIGLTLPNGTINGSPSEKDREEIKDKLGRNESIDSRGKALLMTFKDIVKNHSALKVKDYGKTTLVDVQSANVVLKLYDALSDKNKESLFKMPVPKMIKVAYEVLGKK